jgi:hypothetical protein
MRKVLGHGLVWCEQRALCRAGPAAQAPSVEDVLVNAFLRMDNDMSRYNPHSPHPHNAVYCS